MFKLVKIENSGTNYPEPIKMKVLDTERYYAGAAYELSAGYLTPIGETSIPTHVALESYVPGNKNYILCYRITPDMIFELPLKKDQYCYEGTRYNVYTEGGNAVGLGTQAEGGALVVTDANGAKNIGDKLYAFVSRP